MQNKQKKHIVGDIVEKTKFSQALHHSSDGLFVDKNNLRNSCQNSQLAREKVIKISTTPSKIIIGRNFYFIFIYGYKKQLDFIFLVGTSSRD